jgi:hypothetical protein
MKTKTKINLSSRDAVDYQLAYLKLVQTLRAIFQTRIFLVVYTKTTKISLVYHMNISVQSDEPIFWGVLTTF